MLEVDKEKKMNISLFQNNIPSLGPAEQAGGISVLEQVTGGEGCCAISPNTTAAVTTIAMTTILDVMCTTNPRRNY